MSSSDLLQADAGALDSCGQDFLNCGGTVQDTLNRIRNNVNNLTGSFQGSAAAAFYAKMDTLAQQMQLLCDEVCEMGNDLKNTATKVRQLQAEAEALLRD